MMHALSCASDLSHLLHFRVCFLIQLFRTWYNQWHIPHNQWHIPHNHWSIELRWYKTYSCRQRWDYWRYLFLYPLPLSKTTAYNYNISILYSLGGQNLLELICCYYSILTVASAGPAAEIASVVICVLLLLAVPVTAVVVIYRYGWKNELH